jgi:hypothetical protein
VSERLTYFASFPAVGKIKIGSSVNPERRLRTLKCKYKHVGIHKLVGALPSEMLSEADAHAMFATHRIKGEWYKPTASMLRKIKGLLPKGWERRVPRQYGTWLGKKDVANMMARFPAATSTASSQLMVDSILAAIKSGKL